MGAASAWKDEELWMREWSWKLFCREERALRLCRRLPVEVGSAPHTSSAPLPSTMDVD
jgi:hypothetical protein